MDEYTRMTEIRSFLTALAIVLTLGAIAFLLDTMVFT